MSKIELRDLEKGLPVRPKILICDDEAVLRALVRASLAGGDYELLEARDGDEGLEVARAEQPQLILLDVTMPLRTGLEVLELLRADAVLAATPVIMLTGRAREQDRAAAAAAGATDFLAKPFSPLDLAALVERTLGVDAPPAAGPTNVLMKPFSREHLLESIGDLVPSGRGSILVVDDDEMVRRLVVTTLGREGLDLEEASDGVEALARIAQRRPDVIVLDLEMPELDGFGVLERLRESRETRSIPVIVLSGRNVTPAERARLRHQTVAFRQKSTYSTQELSRLVQEALG